MMKIPDDVRVPRRLARMPTHKGLPVPAMVQFDAQGVPDFRVIDMEKWLVLARARRCGLCGAGLGISQWSIGGPRAIEARTFTDLPMHLDCAEFALRVCPYLALPRFKMTMAEVQIEGHTIQVNEHVETRRPERFGLGRALGYQVMLVGKSHWPVIEAEPFTDVHWWRHGERIA